MLLCWSMLVSIGLSFMACTKKDSRDSTVSDGQSLPPGTEVGLALINSPAALVAEQIRTRIEAVCVGTDLRVCGDPVYASEALPGFYVRRLNRPAWSGNGHLSRLVIDLVNALRRADLDGLRSQDYHLAAIRTLLSAVRGDIRNGGVIVPDRWAELDLLLTDAFLVYGSHLLAGRVNPETLKPEWVANRRGADLAVVLESALASGDVAGALAALEPPQRGFQRLREALVYHRAVVARGGWPTIPDGPKLKRGDYGLPVAALHQRLRLGCDLVALEWMDPQLYDEALEQALKRFQTRYGLTADGVVDSATRSELNVSAQRRVEQLEVNLERWRWLPKDLGRRHIIVNIPAFELEVVEDNAVVLAMRVVVGQPYQHTPVFSETMRYLVLNPYWEVPHDIAVQDVLPHVKRDFSYLSQQQMQMFQGWGPDARAIDPATVNWSAITPDSFPFRLAQNPGPVNALGRIKFMFLNKFNVYLHDTPARPLFAETQRDFSHGCIRIQKPLELALYLLRKDPKWNREALLHALDEMKDRSVPLPEPIPIHLLYWTAWADEDGTIEFRRDIYGQDAPLLAALRAPSPAKKQPASGTSVSKKA
jgi:murein L,D-transpeptidase YcbB/YkuD